MLPQVLVLDDDHETRQAVRTALEGYGVELVCAVDGDHALGKLVSQPIAALIMETAIEPQGLQNLRRIMRLRPHLPVIVLTRSSSAELQAACEQMGVLAYLRKPATGEQLLRALAPEELSPADNSTAADAVRGA